MPGPSPRQDVSGCEWDHSRSSRRRGTISLVNRALSTLALVALGALAAARAHPELIRTAYFSAAVDPFDGAEPLPTSITLMSFTQDDLEPTQLCIRYQNFLDGGKVVRFDLEITDEVGARTQSFKLKKRSVYRSVCRRFSEPIRAGSLVVGTYSFASEVVPGAASRVNVLFFFEEDAPLVAAQQATSRTGERLAFLSGTSLNSAESLPHPKKGQVALVVPEAVDDANLCSQVDTGVNWTGRNARIRVRTKVRLPDGTRRGYIQKGPFLSRFADCVPIVNLPAGTLLESTFYFRRFRRDRSSPITFRSSFDTAVSGGRPTAD